MNEVKSGNEKMSDKAAKRLFETIARIISEREGVKIEATVYKKENGELVKL